MNWLNITFSVFTLICVISTVYQFYKMAALDAKGRGLAQPKLLGLLAASGQRGEGLILYLLRRRGYPSTMSQDETVQMKSIKARCVLSLVLVATGAAGLLITLNVLS